MITGSGADKPSPNTIADGPLFSNSRCCTGLGLNLVYNVIKNHNGSIHVESDVGKGANFTIRLDVDGGAVGA